MADAKPEARRSSMQRIMDFLAGKKTLESAAKQGAPAQPMKPAGPAAPGYAPADMRRMAEEQRAREQKAATVKKVKEKLKLK